MTGEPVGFTLDQLRPFLAQMIGTAFDEGRRKLTSTGYGPGTIISSDPATGICQVIPDDMVPPSQVAAHTLVGLPSPSARVMLQYTPPAGLYVVGYLSPLRTPRALGIHLRQTVGLPIASGGFGTAITWDTVEQDDDGFLTGGAITIPAGLGGRYTCATSLRYSTTPADGERAAVQIQAPGYLWPWRSSCPPGTGEDVASPSAVFSVNEGDVVSIVAFHTMASSPTVTGDVEMWRLGD